MVGGAREFVYIHNTHTIYINVSKERDGVWAGAT